MPARNLSTLISELNLCNKTASSTAIFAVRCSRADADARSHLAASCGSLNLAAALALWQSSHERLQFLIELSVLDAGLLNWTGTKTFPGRAWAGVWFMVYAPPFLVY